MVFVFGIADGMRRYRDGPKTARGWYLLLDQPTTTPANTRIRLPTASHEPASGPAVLGGGLDGNEAIIGTAFIMEAKHTRLSTDDKVKSTKRSNSYCRTHEANVMTAKRNQDRELCATLQRELECCSITPLAAGGSCLIGTWLAYQSLGYTNDTSTQHHMYKSLESSELLESI